MLNGRLIGSSSEQTAAELSNKINSLNTKGSNLTKPEDSHAERFLHEDFKVTQELLNVTALHNKTLSMDLNLQAYGGQCQDEGYSLTKKVSIKNHKSLALQAESSQIRRANPEAPVQDSSSDDEDNTLERSAPIKDRKRSAHQVGPSRIMQENLVAPIQGFSSQDEGNDLRNNAPIKDRKRSALQTGPCRLRQENLISTIQESPSQDKGNDLRNNSPIKDLPTALSWFRQEKLISPIKDSSSQDEGIDLRNNGSNQGHQRFAQEADSSHRDENPAAQTNALRNHLLSSEVDMVPTGYDTVMPPQRLLDNIDRERHTATTRQAISPTRGPRRGSSPMKILNPRFVEDIVVTVSRNCVIPRYLVRRYIAAICEREARVYRNRKKWLKRKDEEISSSSSDS